jgi:hypothetical protein
MPLAGFPGATRCREKAVGCLEPVWNVVYKERKGFTYDLNDYQLKMHEVGVTLRQQASPPTQRRWPLAVTTGLVAI